MSKLSQQGVIHFLLLFILLAGIIGGVFLVTNGNPLKLFSKAGGGWLVVKDQNGIPYPQIDTVTKITSASVKLEFYAPYGLKPTTSVSGPAQVYTVSYKIAENPTDLTAAQAVIMTQSPTQIDWIFKDPNPGQKFIWGEFTQSDGTTIRNTSQIELVSPSTSGPIPPSPTTTPTNELKLMVNTSEIATAGSFTVVWHNIPYPDNSDKIVISDSTHGDVLTLILNFNCRPVNFDGQPQTSGVCNISRNSGAIGFPNGNYRVRLVSGRWPNTTLITKDFTIQTNPTPTPTPKPTPNPKADRRIFVTSATYNGNLGGLIGADSKCQQAASSANLGGSFKAWASDGTTSASSRLEHANVPYKLVNGSLVAKNWNDLVDGNIQNAIKIDEQGRRVSYSRVWTNTKANGSIANTNSRMNCSNFTSSAINSFVRGGYNGATYNIWSLYSQLYCSAKAGLYCVEQ